MNFNKVMIDLVQEIRRRAPSESKPSIKLANPELFTELLNVYKAKADTVSKALIKELFEIAGDPWPQALKEETTPDQRYVTQVYRGQVTHVAADLPSPTAEKLQSKVSQRIYRGQVVNG